MIVKEVPFYNRALYGLEFSVMAFFYAAVLLVAVIGDNRFFHRVLCNPLLMKLVLSLMEPIFFITYSSTPLALC